MTNKRKMESVPIRNKPTALDKDMGEQQQARERSLDETIAETFPASDPLSSDPNPVRDEREEKDKLAS